jgi:uroporphyrinogen-III synthase
VNLIPKVIRPLMGLSVLVTRPIPQGEVLCAAIHERGGVARSFPTLEIQPLAACVSAVYELAIFVSANAVQHGLSLFVDQPNLRLAAIGRATAAAMKQAGRPPQVVPETDFNSEALLAHPELLSGQIRRVVIVRGEGGRELLHDTLTARGLEVHSCEVYRRVIPRVDPAALDALEQYWSEDGVDAVTVTSVETLHNLLTLLPERSRARLRTTPLIVASERIAQAATELGLRGPVIDARGADDASMLGALANWHARGRASLVRSLG